jgi:hypothetical protein
LTAAGLQLTATNPSTAVVDLSWADFPYPSDYVILWQCAQNDGCFDTLRPNSGNTELTGVQPGTYGYEVCEPGPKQDICTNAVALDVN